MTYPDFLESLRNFGTRNGGEDTRWRMDAVAGRRDTLFRQRGAQPDGDLALVAGTDHGASRPPPAERILSYRAVLRQPSCTLFRLFRRLLLAESGLSVWLSLQDCCCRDQPPGKSPTWVVADFFVLWRTLLGCGELY